MWRKDGSFPRARAERDWIADNTGFVVVVVVVGSSCVVSVVVDVGGEPSIEERAGSSLCVEDAS